MIPSVFARTLSAFHTRSFPHNILLRVFRRKIIRITPEMDNVAIEVVKGLSLRHISMPAGPARGRALIFDIEDFEPRIYPLYELINKSFDPKWGYCPPPEINLGVTVPQLLARSKPESRRIPREEVSRFVFACNTLHTNFVRGNGFVVTDGELVCKPPGAVALDGHEYFPVGHHPLSNPDNARFLPYETLILAPGLPEVRTVDVNKNVLLSQENIQLAISGPRLVEASKNVVDRIPIRPKEQGQTVGNEINYDPYTERTSFTAFGVEQGTNKIIAVSMFAGEPSQLDDDTRFFKVGQGQGITLDEMAELMIALRASDAIAGGGAGDTQQYIYKEGIWAGQPRHQPNRPQVEGLRGLGAIFALLASNNRQEAC